MAGGGFVVRTAVEKDADGILAISVALRGVPGADPLPAIADTNRLVVVAEADGAIVGWGKTHHYPLAEDAAPAGHFLGGVSVLTEFRRRRIGEELTRARLDWIALRASDAWFAANAKNTASIAMHSPFGFVEVARAAEFHGTPFEGGEGVLFHLAL